MSDVAGINRGRYSIEEFERQYNPRQAVPDHQDKIDARVTASAEARCRIEGVYDLRYGPGPLEVLDVYPAEAEAAPVQLYIHGGYWRAQDKSDVSFFAEPFTAAGATVVIVNYDLCPNVSLPEIMAEIAPSPGPTAILRNGMVTPTVSTSRAIPPGPIWAP
jgi:arylformamidase